MARIPKKLSQTTEIYFNEYNSTAVIITYNHRLKKKLAEFAEKFPDCCELRTRYSDSGGGVKYVIDKSRMSIRFMSPCSEERKEMYTNILKSINHKEGDCM